MEELEKGTPGRLKVTAKSTESDETFEGEFNTVSGFTATFYYPTWHLPSVDFPTQQNVAHYRVHEGRLQTLILESKSLVLKTRRKSL